MHSEYDDDEEECFWFVIHPLKDISAFELFCDNIYIKNLKNDNADITAGDRQVQEHWEEAVHGPADHQWVWWVVQLSITILTV